MVQRYLRARLSQMQRAVSPSVRGTGWPVLLQYWADVYKRQVNDAMDHGISMIHQEFALSEQLSVADNIFMGREPVGKFGLTDRKALYTKAQELIDKVGGNRCV